jgi:hypothetical protein
MNRFKFFLIFQFLITTIFLFSCSKASDRRCFKTSGNIVVRTFEVNGFTSLKLHKFIRFILVPDTVDYVEVQAGKNLINFVNITSEGGILEISNRNTCDFLRSWKRDVSVFVHAKKINNIYFDGTETLTSSDTLRTDFLTFHQQDGSGNVDLFVRSFVLQSSQTNSAGNLSIHGFTDYLKVETNGLSSLDTKNLVVKDSIRFVQNSLKEILLNANLTALYGDINNSGAVKYFGSPSLIGVNIIGSGKLIQLND